MALLRNNQLIKKMVALYGRVSTVEQATEGYSIDEQIRLLREYCEENGYEIYNEYTDRGISGKSITARPALQELLKDAKERKFDLVLVWKTNRLARNMLDLLKMIDMLDKNGIAFKSATEKFETETPSGRLSLHVMASVAEFERGTIAQNVKMGMIARAREGKWNGGIVLGYDIVTIPNENKKRKETKLVVNEIEAQTVRRIFQLYVEGNGYKSIVNAINQEGHRTKKDNFFAVATLKEILKNPVYIGKIRYNVRQDWSEKRRRNINPNPTIVDGEHESIIDIDTWDKAQLLLEKRSGKPSRVHDGEFLLTGLLRCPECGAGMVTGRTTNTNKDGSKRILEYYVCGAWKNKGKAACHSNSVRADYADKYVLEKISTLADSETLIKDIVNSMNKGNKSKTAPLQKEYDVLKKNLAKIQSKKDKTMELYEEELISKEDLSFRMAKLNSEKVVLEDRLGAIILQLNQEGSQQVSFKLVKTVLKNFNNILKNSSTREQRKQLMHLLLSEITADKSRKIDTIKIQINRDVLNYISNSKEEESSDGDDSSSFSTITIAI